MSTTLLFPPATVLAMLERCLFALVLSAGEPELVLPA